MSLLHKYEIRSSRRSRGLRVTVHRDGRVVVTKPLSATDARVERFLGFQLPWIERKITEFSRRPVISLQKPRTDYVARKEEARRLVHERLEHFNALYGFRYGTVSIKSQRSRWGSCSARKNLSFNYKILYLSPEEADYIIVHELCHLKEMNHGPDFWKLVAQASPEYEYLKRSLRKYVL